MLLREACGGHHSDPTMLNAPLCRAARLLRDERALVYPQCSPRRRRRPPHQSPLLSAQGTRDTRRRCQQVEWG